MIRRLLQIIFAVSIAGTLAAADLSFTDVDGRSHSLHHGKVTLLTIISRDQQAQADAVGARLPDRFLGDPRYQIVTVVKFDQPGYTVRKVAGAIIRRRLDALAARLRAKYSAHGIKHDPRSDLFVVADFDGRLQRALNVQANSDKIAVFLFDFHGRLQKRWSSVPPASDLAAQLSKL